MAAALERWRRGRGFFLAVSCFFLAAAVPGCLLQVAPDAPAARLFSYACVVLAVSLWKRE